MPTVTFPHIKVRTFDGWLDCREGSVETDPAPVGWQDAYDSAYSTGSTTLVDAWYDANTGRTSEADLLDLGGQVTVTTSFLTTNASSNPDHVFQEGGRWIIQDVLCANFRITSASLPLTVRQCSIQRRGNTYLYAVHSPTTSPVHNIIIEDCTLDGEDEPSGAYAVYMPSNNSVDDDTIVRRCKIDRFQSGVRGVAGTTMEYCLVTDSYYFAESHNTAASFRGSHSRVYRNRVRPGITGSSGINFYAEVAHGDPPRYDYIYMVENMIHASEALVAVNFPDGDDPGILYSDTFPGMTRICTGNIVDTRFSNPSLWGTMSGNIHWDGSDADDGSLPD
jgi:hypothetical protein